MTLRLLCRVVGHDFGNARETFLNSGSEHRYLVRTRFWAGGTLAVVTFACQDHAR